MAATASASSAGPRYAPHDPTLPKPWKGLVDGSTGYLYFWNPETNVTQYERPGGGPHSGQPPVAKSAPISSSVHVQQSSNSSTEGGRKHQDEDDRYNIGGNDIPKLATVPTPRNVQIQNVQGVSHRMPCINTTVTSNQLISDGGYQESSTT